MTKIVLDMLIKRINKPVYKIETDLGMKHGTLAKFTKGKRKLAEHWHKKLADYADGNYVPTAKVDKTRAIPNDVYERLSELESRVSRLEKTGLTTESLRTNSSYFGQPQPTAQSQQSFKHRTYEQLAQAKIECETVEQWETLKAEINNTPLLPVQKKILLGGK